MNTVTRRPHDRSESGFTIIEVMVAALILVIGVLATFTMFDSASALTVDNRAREGATNLARELVDDARSADYDALSGTQTTPTLQSLPNLTDANLAKPGWQIVRRGFTYTATATACTFDSNKDGARTVAADDSSFCTNSVHACKAGLPVDGNPDDYRRVEISITWARPGRTPVCGGQNQSTTATRNAVCVLQSGLIANPAGGLGPAIDSTSFVQTPTNVVETTPANTVTVTFKTRTAADTIDWGADDAASSGTGTNMDSTFKNWSLTWGCPCPPGVSLPTLDGNYTLSIQAFLLSVPGDVTPYVVSLNRFLPNAPTLPTAPTLPAGVDSRQRNAIPQESPNFVVDLNWTSNPERDIAGYAVFQQLGATPKLNGTLATLDRVACTTHSSTVTNCLDTNPPTSGTATYYVVAFDQPWTKPGNTNPTALNCGSFGNVDTILTGQKVQAFDAQFNGATTPRAGCPSSTFSVDISAGLNTNTPPTKPASGAGTIGSNGLPHLTWAASTDPDAGDSVVFYRVYRDPSTTNPVPYSPRYDRTSSSAPSYDDSAPGASTTHRYFVTAVDKQYQESQPLEIDTP